MTDSQHQGGPSAAGPALRFPGGRLRHDDWTAMASLAADHGGGVQLTRRGGARIVGPHGEAVPVRDAAAAGLPDHVLHSRARDIIASPMAGRVPGHHDLVDLPDRLGAALRDRAGTDAVGGQVLFGVDDGSGDVTAHSPDLAVVLDGPEARVRVAGRDTPVVVPVADASTVLADVAALFAGSAGPVRVPATGPGHQMVVDALLSHPLTGSAPDAVSDGLRSEGPQPDGARSDGSRSGGVAGHGAPAPVALPPVGWVDTSDGLVSLLAVVPDGVVPARLAEFLGAVERPSTISADRVIGLHELTEDMAEQVARVLAPMGMIFDAASPWVTGSA